MLREEQWKGWGGVVPPKLDDGGDHGIIQRDFGV